MFLKTSSKSKKSPRGDKIKKTESSDKISRRDILKLGSIGTAATAVSTLAVSSKAAEKVVSTGVKKVTNTEPEFHSSLDDVVKIDKNLKRFDNANTAFMKSFLSDFGVIPLKPEDNPKIRGGLTNIIFGWTGFNPVTGEKNPHLAKQKPGHTDLDYALSRGGFALEDYSGSFLARTCSGDSGPAMQMPGGKLLPLTLYKQGVPFPGIFEKFPRKYKFENTQKAAYAIKKAAKLFGADLVGIAPFEERWLYNTEVFMPLDPIKGQPYKKHVNPFRKVELGFKPKSVIVLAFEMDYEAYKTQPSAIGETATSMGYSRMMETSLRIAYMLRRLGYNARHAGNDTGLSIPLAVQAGLGEGSRMGMLITEEYGPRVRIAKVYTDLDIAKDKPKTFGVKQFCEVCQVCADSCPSKAISKSPKTTDPENKPINECNNPGVDKWFNDHQKCLQFWKESWSECGVCISVCPYNKPQMWNHDFAKLITRVPGLNRIARYLDNVFGYGKAYDEKLMKDFWKKTI